MSKKQMKLSPKEINSLWAYLTSFFQEKGVQDVHAVTEEVAEAFFRLGPLTKGFLPQTLRLLKSEQTYLQLSKSLGGGYWIRLGYWTRGSYYPPPKAQIDLTKGFLCACLSRTGRQVKAEIAPEVKAHIAHLRRKAKAAKEDRPKGLSRPFNEADLPAVAQAVEALEGNAEGQMQVRVGDRLIVAKGPNEALSKISFSIV